MPDTDIRRLLAGLFVTIGVFVVVDGTLYPNAAIPFGLNNLCAHVLIYYVLAMVFIIARPRSAGRSVLLLVGLGATTEVAQLFVPLRQADGMDLVANIFGIGAAYASWRLVGLCFAGSLDHPSTHWPRRL